MQFYRKILTDDEFRTYGMNKLTHRPEISFCVLLLIILYLAAKKPNDNVRRTDTEACSAPEKETARPVLSAV